MARGIDAGLRGKGRFIVCDGSALSLPLAARLAMVVIVQGVRNVVQRKP